MTDEHPMIDCPHCNEPIAAESIICPFCFSGVSAHHFEPCSSCGEKIWKNANRCRFCKTKIERIDRHAPAPPPTGAEQEARRFRQTFLQEIGNLLTYCRETTDALSMVVNILGRALEVSRCIVYCTLDGTLWHYSQYFNRANATTSSMDLDWKPSKSALVAKVVLAKEPLVLHLEEASVAAQEELNKLKVITFLGLPLPEQNKVRGCVIIHQCDGYREWSGEEIEWLTQITRELAEGLNKRAS